MSISNMFFYMDIYYMKLRFWDGDLYQEGSEEAWFTSIFLANLITSSLRIYHSRIHLCSITDSLNLRHNYSEAVAFQDVYGKGTNLSSFSSSWDIGNRHQRNDSKQIRSIETEDLAKTSWRVVGGLRMDPTKPLKTSTTWSGLVYSHPAVS